MARSARLPVRIVEVACTQQRFRTLEKLRACWQSYLQIRLTPQEGERLTRAQSGLLVLTLGSPSHTEASVFGREIPELRLDRILEPDWWERWEPELKGSDCQNNLAHDRAALAIRPESDSFRCHDFQNHDDRSSTNTDGQLACHGETDSYHKRPQQLMHKLLRLGKLLPPSPNADRPSASALLRGASLDGVWQNMASRSG